MRSRIFVGLIAGALGGFLGWLIQESLIPYAVVKDALDGVVRVVPLTAQQSVLLITCVGGLIGTLLGAVDGIVEGNRRKLVMGMLIGFAGGVFLGWLGFNSGNYVYNKLGGADDAKGGLGILVFLQKVIARTIGWALMGLGIGVGTGLSTRTPKRIMHGALGGLLGGLAGGFVFNLVPLLIQPVQIATSHGGAAEGGGPSRMIGFTAIGALSGLFIGIVEELLKEAWVKVLAGKNEGKDFLLSKPMNILGRDERCDVPLFGDNSVGTQHAAIRSDGSRRILVDAGTPAGTVVNGQQVPSGGEMLLRDGDMIQIGTHRILFREKATASKLARPALDTPKSKPASAAAVQVPSHLCPFCGAPKDVQGGCRCGVPGSPAVGAGVAVNPGYGGAPGPGSMMNSGASMGGYSAPDSLRSVPIPRGGADMARFVGIEGPYTGEVFLLTSPNTTIGREPGRDIVLSADATVSRSHARVSNENGDLVLYDVGSANGTFVNGMRVQMQVLVPGDIVQLGHGSKFRYE